MQDENFSAILRERPEGRITDFGEAAIFPGTVNTHTHSMQSLIRGYGDDKEVLEWLKGIVYQYCKQMDERHAYWGALLSFAEMVENGITTVVDFFYLNGEGNKCSRAVIRAARDLGIRLVLARTMMDWEDAPETVREIPEVAVDRFLELYDEFKNDSMIRVCPAPHSAVSTSPKMIQEALRLSEELDLPCHMHVSASKGIMELVQKLRGREYVRFLKENGALTPRFVAVHCIWCGEDEIQLLAEGGARVSHNPVSMKFLGEPSARIVSMLNQGIVVGLGTDGAAGNNRLSIFQEMKAAALDQKSLYQNPQAIDSDTVLRMGTEYAAKIADFPVGRIEEGLGADFIVIDLADLSLVPEKQLKSHLVYSFSERSVTHVYVGGNPILEKGQFTRIDAAQLKANVEELTRIWDTGLA